MDLSVAVKAIEEKFGVLLENPRIVEISEERRIFFSDFFHDPSGMHAVVGLVDGDVKEYVVESTGGGEVVIPEVCCQITYEDLSLSECIEYCFADEVPFPTWHVAQISALAVDDFKAKKFKLWEHQLDEPECEAAFRRLLQQGPIRNVYDKFIFPSPDSVASNYKVTDEHSGKTVNLPHQVARMRIWNPSKGDYDEFDPVLIGAPKNESDAKIYWEKRIKQLCELRGKEYIESLLGV